MSVDPSSAGATTGAADPGDSARAGSGLERSMLEGKDREQLITIATALGVRGASRAKKADIVDKILAQTTGAPAAPTRRGRAASAAVEPEGAPSEPAAVLDPAPTVPPSTADGERDDASAPSAGPGGDPVARAALGAEGGRDDAIAPGGDPVAARAEPGGDPGAAMTELGDAGPPGAPASVAKGGDGPGDAIAPIRATAVEPPAHADADGDDDGDGDGDEGDWEGVPGALGTTATNGDGDGDGARLGEEDRGEGRPPLGPTFAALGEQGPPGEVREGSSRRRRRNRNRDRRLDGAQGGDRFPPEAAPSPPARIEEPAVSTTSEVPVDVSGYLDLRDEGYGFLRVHGYLPSRDDVYISVKQTRQYGLRRGDHITGLSRSAGRNEKNPALLRLDTVNGGEPDAIRARPRFEDLTPLFPDQKLRLESPSDPYNMTARIIDLIAPIGKGQRGLIVSPPKAGKTTILKTIATAIERNNPEVTLMVLLIDERPEEVTDMRRTVKGEVIASTFDRPSEEHTHVAELVIERAKRMVESGADVVVVLDGITRLSRAYNLAAPATGRIMSGGIDAGALYPPKKFFGAARNIEEGGSLTILATALVETNSRMDDAIFEEFKGTGNMELRLDRKLSERRIFPAIDVDASSTRHEELLFDRRQLQQVWKLRRVLSGLAADGSAEAGLNLLVDRLKTFRSNDDFLSEVARQPGGMQ